MVSIAQTKWFSCNTKVWNLYKAAHLLEPGLDMYLVVLLCSKETANFYCQWCSTKVCVCKYLQFTDEQKSLGNLVYLRNCGGDGGNPNALIIRSKYTPIVYSWGAKLEYVMDLWILMENAMKRGRSTHLMSVFCKLEKFTCLLIHKNLLFLWHTESFCLLPAFTRQIWKQKPAPYKLFKSASLLWSGHLSHQGHIWIWRHHPGFVLLPLEPDLDWHQHRDGTGWGPGQECHQPLHHHGYRWTIDDQDNQSQELQQATGGGWLFWWLFMNLHHHSHKILWLRSQVWSSCLVQSVEYEYNSENNVIFFWQRSRDWHDVAAAEIQAMKNEAVNSGS